MDYWGGQRVCWSPRLKLLGGGARAPPSSYAYDTDYIANGSGLYSGKWSAHFNLNDMAYERCFVEVQF